ncbi:MAG: Rne/Rng family ribonuclease [Desulfofustis sp.]|nr:Rne/Rng family ribonuclease [Desulfofustis sp.]
MAPSEKDGQPSEKNNLITKIKTTTGAWWKSKIIHEKEAPDPAEPPSPPDKAAPLEGRKDLDYIESSGSNQISADQNSDDPAKVESEVVDQVIEKDQAPAGSDPENAEISAEPDGEPGSTESPRTEGKEHKPRRGRSKRSSKSKSQKAKEKSDEPDSVVATSPAKSQGKKTDSQAGKEHQPVVKLLINADEPEECRLALLEDGRLESLHVTTISRVQTRNNIYKARVVAVESNLQAAFVDYGVEKNGFLAFTEIHPEYYKQELPPDIQKLVETQQWKKLSIKDVIAKGQEMLVQVVKEEVGKKGANLTTYLSIPGRCVVLMPGSDSEGVSRKIAGEERRGRLREIMNSLSIPEGIGWIVRTASEDITKTALTKDVRFLLKLWKEIKSKGQHLEGVGLLYQDHNCVMRFLREHFDPTTQEILVDDQSALEKVKDFTEMLPAKQRQVKVKLHRGARPIFNQYSVEDQIESIYQPNVNLPSGGSIVIEPTEAMVSIDVNSGSTGKGKNFEETIFQANMEAATELARQLRLRDLGGLIVVDFIDMRSSKNVREVEKQVKTAMKRDKAKVDISRISRFGLMQISRQKLGSPIESSNYRVCEHCRGRGMVKSVEMLSLFYLRRIHTGASRRPIIRIDCRFPIDVSQYLLNNKRQEILELEEKYDAKVMITADPTLKPAEHEILFRKQEKEEAQKQT